MAPSSSAAGPRKRSRSSPREGLRRRGARAASAAGRSAVGAPRAGTAVIAAAPASPAGPVASVPVRRLGVRLQLGLDGGDVRGLLGPGLEVGPLAAAGGATEGCRRLVAHVEGDVVPGGDQLLR